MDTYSNLLYVKEMRVELANLAHRATEIDKYRLETCCIVGKFVALLSVQIKGSLLYYLVELIFSRKLLQFKRRSSKGSDVFSQGIKNESTVFVSLDVTRS